MKSIFTRLKALEGALEDAMHIDRAQLHRGIRQVRRQWSRRVDQDLGQRVAAMEAQLTASMQRRNWRQQHRPAAVVASSLPISAKQSDITGAIRRHPVVIVSGETGSGKTTQIPKCCLAAGRGVAGIIGCTQPRRIAATSVARRIAEELSEPLGQSVGYKIRFKESSGENPFIKLMTDGILLAETQRDPCLYAYDTLIVDEAHERSLNIDFILGIVKSLIAKRRDLKLIISSATIDTEKFSKNFDGAPVIEVSGRMYPVDVRYRDISAADKENASADHIESAVDALQAIHKRDPSGDVLIFMPTEQDIRDCCELIESRPMKPISVLPLFARLPASQQKKVFQRPAARKVIVATNIAETSITIPGIKYVIDSGLARISQYTPRSRVTALPIVPISQSSADQRKGRCGRVANGVCIRLYSRSDFESRPRFTKPEILRTNLAEVILRMLSLRLGDIENFAFIDKPADKSIQDGLRLLMELGAIERVDRPPSKSAPVLKKRTRKKSRRDGSGMLAAFRLTATGKRMAKIPIDPRLARIIVEAAKRGCLAPIVTIVAVLSTQDPRERPQDRESQADSAQAVFVDPRSDFMTLLNIWNAFQKAVAKGPGATGRMKRFCQKHYLSFRRMREWSDIQTQIGFIVKGIRLAESKSRPHPSTGSPNGFDPFYEAVHQSILSGFLSNVAQQKEKHFFKAAGGRAVMLFPGSVTFNRPGAWIVCAEMVQTSRLFARDVAVIDPSWIEAVGRAQCRFTYLDPHWDKKRGTVVARQQVSLYGLTLSADRVVPYGPIDAQTANDIFIREALVADDIHASFDFLNANRNLVQAVRNLERRVRRQDILVDEEIRYQFYKDRLPDVVDLVGLKKRIRSHGGDHFLKMHSTDLQYYAPDPDELARFPESVRLDHRPFRCLYRFDPGADNDGVTLCIPQNAAPQIDPDALEWIVPGLLFQKIEILLKNLPKRYRKQLVPLADTLALIRREMPRHKGSLPSRLSAFIHQRFKVDIPASAWPVHSLPAHLKLRITLTDGEGRRVLSTRDPSMLNRPAEIPLDDVLLAAKRSWEKEDLDGWTFGDLPRQVILKDRNNAATLFYPGLRARDSRIDLTLFRNRQTAAAEHEDGLIALFSRLFRSDLRFLQKNLALPPKSKAWAGYFGGAAKLNRMLYRKVVRGLFPLNIRTEAAFHRQAENLATAGMHTRGQNRRQAVLRVLQAFHDARQTIDRLANANRDNPQITHLLQHLETALKKLIPENFIELYDTPRLERLPAYIAAIATRAEKAAVNFEKDRRRLQALQPFENALQKQIRALSAETSDEKRTAIEDFHWLLQEYKISIFAQELGTAVRVSPKTLQKALSQLERMV